MDDEAWKASQRRKRELQTEAKNPPENVTLYRMQGGDPSGSLGIHWTTDQNVAHYTGLSGGEGHVHRATVNRRDIIFQGEWMGRNIRSVHDPRPESFKTGPTQWGLDMEAEVRLRPGATVREHAVAPKGTHEYEPTGREPTIESRGTYEYADLAHSAVQGTPEAERLHSLQGRLPHIQQALFDPVHAGDEGKHIGYTPKWDVLRSNVGSLDKAIDFTEKDLDRIGAGAGYGKYEAYTEKAHEPLLSELRPRQAEFQIGHKRDEIPGQGSLL